MNTPFPTGKVGLALVLLALLPSCTLMKPDLGFGPALGAALAYGGPDRPATAQPAGAATSGEPVAVPALSHGWSERDDDAPERS